MKSLSIQRNSFTNDTVLTVSTMNPKKSVLQRQYSGNINCIFFVSSTRLSWDKSSFLCKVLELLLQKIWQGMKATHRMTRKYN